MKPEMHSLLRKEWRERRIAFAACSGWMLCCVFYVIAYEWMNPSGRGAVMSFQGTSVLYVLLAGVFLAMPTALGEQTNGTLGFSLSLPVGRKRIAWTKLAGGVMTLIIPIVLGAIVMTPFLWSGFVEQAPGQLPSAEYIPREERPSFSPIASVGLLGTATAIIVASGTQYLLILSIFGARRRCESHIGFFGAVLALAWIMLGGVGQALGNGSGWLGALFPASIRLDSGRATWALLLINVFVLALLAQWFVCRYGTRRQSQHSATLVRWRRWPAVWSRIPVPLPNRAAALVWINLRQSLPIAFSGLVVGALLTVSILPLQQPQYGDGPGFRDALPGSTWFVATLWATMVGAGIFASELRPGLAGFWRSRPIAVSSWFWWKFFTGLTAVLVVLDGVTILVAWGTPVGITTGVSSSYIACMPILHASLYAMAVFAVCWTRHPVAGAMAAIAVFVVTSIVVDSMSGRNLDPIGVHNNLLRGEMNGQFNLAGHNYPLVYGAMLAMIAASAWLAYRAIRVAPLK